ncbi:MAG: ArsR family transcriptional regulator, partial [Candidatus Thermoplasmatota archaeon]|nr:ArsR family transcriptional regulator [Candidatus Thermoplasmatota archaeon]
MADDESMREQVLGAIEHFPGIHFRGIARELETSTALVRYHLQALEEEGAVRREEVGGYTRYFPAQDYEALTEEEREMLNVLRQERPLEIVLALLELGAMQHKDILEIVGGSKGTLTYHLNKLIDAGVVYKVARGDDRG